MDEEFICSGVLADRPRADYALKAYLCPETSHFGRIWQSDSVSTNQLLGAVYPREFFGQGREFSRDYSALWNHWYADDADNTL